VIATSVTRTTGTSDANSRVRREKHLMLWVSFVNK
jgi:hypothetical protein